MPKIVSAPEAHSLDTLAQLRKPLLKPLQDKGYSEKQISFQRRARAKLLTDGMIYRLVDLNSPLTKSYWQTWQCSRTVVQDGGKLKARYCNQRFCLVCNRIRTARLIQGYSEAFEAMNNPYMVTLTIRNVKGRYLRSSIEAMQKDFVRCKDVMSKRGCKLIGLRKVEVTYNEKTGEFHPHFHCIIDGCLPSFTLVREWLKRHPEQSRISGQDIRHAHDPKGS